MRAVFLVRGGVVLSLLLVSRAPARADDGFCSAPACLASAMLTGGRDLRGDTADAAGVRLDLTTRRGSLFFATDFSFVWSGTMSTPPSTPSPTDDGEEYAYTMAKERFMIGAGMPFATLRVGVFGAVEIVADAIRELNLDYGLCAEARVVVPVTTGLGIIVAFVYDYHADPVMAELSEGDLQMTPSHSAYLAVGVTWEP